MQRVDFLVSGGEVITTTVDIVRRNRVLNMLWERTTDPSKPVSVQEYTKPTFETVLRHLAGELVDLVNCGLTNLITLFRCAHQYQCYRLLSSILRELERYHSPENVLHIYSMLQPLPELPEIADHDPLAPSAPPETDLRDVDPEQAEFVALLKRTFRRCLEVIDSRSGEVLSSDALLSLPYHQLLELAQRDSLQTRELDIGRGLLRWLRYHSLSVLQTLLTPELRRQLVLGALRVLTMTPKELKKLELEREGVLSREELEDVLRLIHHGSGPLPPQLEDYREYWLCPRARGRSGGGVLKRLMERTRPGGGGGGGGGQEVLDSPERREAALQKRSRRADKVKMALATGVSFIFD